MKRFPLVKSFAIRDVLLWTRFEAPGLILLQDLQDAQAAIVLIKNGLNQQVHVHLIGSFLGREDGVERGLEVELAGKSADVAPGATALVRLSEDEMAPQLTASCQASLAPTSGTLDCWLWLAWEAGRGQ